MLACAGLKPTRDNFLSVGTYLDIHSWIFSPEVHPVGLSHVRTTTESKSVTRGLSRFETCR